MSRTAELDHYENNPYQASAYDTLDQSPDLQTDINIDELHAFVGKRFNYFLRKWTARLQDPTADVGIYWPALLLPALCLGSRKMYRNFFIFSGIQFLVAAVVIVVFMGAIGLKDVPTAVWLIVQLIGNIVCSLGFNGWYLTHATRQIAAAKAQGFYGEHLYRELMQRGGTNVAAAFGLNILMYFAGWIIGFIVAFTIVISRLNH